MLYQQIEENNILKRKLEQVQAQNQQLLLQQSLSAVNQSPAIPQVS